MGTSASWCVSWLSSVSRKGKGDEVTTAPWAGPGNSEGPVAPVDPEKVADDLAPALQASLADQIPFTTAPWPGPGDSEG